MAPPFEEIGMERMTQIFGAALLASSLIGGAQAAGDPAQAQPGTCLLYTSDAADEL